jgi:hypothetical protein
MAPKQTVIDIDEEKLKSLLEKVEARIPPKPKQGMTLREVIMKSRAMINLALKRGYTYEEIAAILTSEGINIKGATLKQYLTESKSKRSKTAPQSKPVVEPITTTAELSSKQDIEPDTKAEVDTNLDTELDIKTAKKADSKQDASSKAKSKSVVRGKFTDMPSNDEL